MAGLARSATEDNRWPPLEENDDSRFSPKFDERSLRRKAVQSQRIRMNSDVDILLVEDSQDDIDLALHALGGGRLGDTVSVVRDGEEALDFLFCRGPFSHRSFDRPPKLVLLDLKLPKIDGQQVRKTIKGEPRTQPIPVVIMTSSCEDVEGYRSGVNSNIQKPVEFDEFREGQCPGPVFGWSSTSQRQPESTGDEQGKP
jgi:CheY-like chemotaxis protein